MENNRKNNKRNYFSKKVYRYFFLYTIYRVSDNCHLTVRGRVEYIELNRKVLYHFAIFVIIIEKLIKKDRRMSARLMQLDDGMATASFEKNASTREFGRAYILAVAMARASIPSPHRAKCALICRFFNTISR